MSLEFEAARGIAHQFLRVKKAKNEEITFDVITDIVDRKVIDSFEGLDRDQLVEVLVADFSVGKGQLNSLSDKEVIPWLDDKKADIPFAAWKRYKLVLHEKDPSFPINDLDDFTDKILDKCVWPGQEGSWDRRGMVVGHVQSGKTSNYVGLINKAVDAGYKLVIVIAGTMNSLRRQTQERIDDGFVGKNSSDNQTENIIGVGNYPIDYDIYSLTSSSIKNGGDFDQNIANRKGIPIGRNPVILVIKKNKSILENLIDWLASSSQARTVDGFKKVFDVPTLIIDDEADSASVNTVSAKKSKAEALEEIKTINRYIRILINLFDKKTFIGYTATPYANLFIPQEWNALKEDTIKGNRYLVGQDLFPRHFIINIRASDNYIGAAKIFGYENKLTDSRQEPLDIFRPVYQERSPFFILRDEEYEDQPEYRAPTNRDELPDYIPENLKESIKAFILTCTVRRLRGHEKKHNSMLVHAVHWIRWIDRIAKLVNEQLRIYKELLQGEDPEFTAELKKLYETDFIPTTTELLETGALGYRDVKIKVAPWEDVENELHRAVSKIVVRAVHGTKSKSNLEYHEIDEIDYDKYKATGLSVIAVGGSRLARGITLEGLSISYYLRASKMYDSLMQMGRWFGYRPGYIDLCRLYTTDELFNWFNHITFATEEMRDDFDEMSAMNLTPDKFQLKVRNHNGLLSITSLNKLYFSNEIDISFSGTNIQTYFIDKSKASVENNFHVFSRMLNKLGTPQVQTNERKQRIKYLMYKNADTDTLTEFIGGYKSKQPSINPPTITEYIRKQKNIIREWTVVIVSNTDEKVKVRSVVRDLGTPVDVKMFTLEIGGTDYELGLTMRNQTGPKRKTQFYSLQKNQIDDKGDRKIDLKLSDKTDKEQRKAEMKGLLLIYMLDERGTENADYGIPITGYSLYFPVIENEAKVKYTVTELREEETDDDDHQDD
jgi:hypothetical protein